jgi:hypothetical protein
MVVSNGNSANNAYAKYSNSQAQSLINDCGEGDSGASPNCAIVSPQMQADGTAPITFQISNPAKEGYKHLQNAQSWR